MSILNPPNITKLSDKDIPSRQLKVNEDGSINSSATIVNPVDSFSGYLISLSPEHSVLHSGGAYNYSSYLPNLTAGSSLYIEFIIPNKNVSFQGFNIISSHTVRSDFYESPTLQDGNNQLLLAQRNRNLTTSAGTIMYDNPSSITNPGTLIRTLAWGTIDGLGTSLSPIIPTGADSFGLMLKPLNKYLLKLTNTSASTLSLLFMTLEIYEY